MTIRYYFEKKEGLAPLRINALRAISPCFRARLVKIPASIFARKRENSRDFPYS